jgi:hypothetical protein
MLTSILPPVVHGGPRRSARRLWLALAALHSLATALSAAAVGAALSAAAWGAGRQGWPLAPWARWLTVGLAVLYLPRALGWTFWPGLLQSTRQVPRDWAYDYPRWATALLFGLGLGGGLYTRVIVPTFYLLFAWPFLGGGFFWPVVLWASYGLARSGHLWWLAWTAPPPDPFPAASRLTFVLMSHARWMYRVNAVLLAAAAAWLTLGGIFP